MNGADGSFPKCHSKHTFLRHKLYRMMFDVEKVLAVKVKHFEEVTGVTLTDFSQEPKESFEPSINMRKGLLPLIEQVVFAVLLSFISKNDSFSFFLAKAEPTEDVSSSNKT